MEETSVHRQSDIRLCMKYPKCIRNICILAHVDHGKTTVADSLLGTNGIITKRSAGTLRYLDDRLDEQERKITMKSSAVSLVNPVYCDVTKTEKLMLLNMIDTPGHIDFSSEVTAAVRVSDGAIILVDVVEGVCVQTRESMKQAFEQKAKMILLLNKLDKLLINKDMHQIFIRISQIIEDCNSAVAQLYQYTESEVDIENTDLLFQPEKGNVIFASAIHGWGFTLKQIAAMFTSMLPDETVESLNIKLWDFDLYIDAKSKSVKKGAIEKAKTNVFTQLCVKTLKHVYKTILVDEDKEKVNVILEKLGIKQMTKDMKHRDSKIQIKSILETWKSLAETILQQCYSVVPAPCAIPSEKIEYLLNKNILCEDPYLNECKDELISHLKNCSSDDAAPVVLYVSKMFCVNKSNLSQNQSGSRTLEESRRIRNEALKNGEEVKEEKDIVTVAFARVFSGNLKVGQEVYVLHHGYMPDKTKIEENIGSFIEGNKYIKKATVKELYVLIGRNLTLVDNIPAGNICAIGGLESSIIRTATVSNTVKCIPFIEQQTLEPVVRNYIEPLDIMDYKALLDGAKELMRNDSCVQFYIQETGEFVLSTSGSVHLEKCLEDLKTKFAKVEFTVSPPMVLLRETIIHESNRYDSGYDESKIVSLTSGPFTVSVIAVSLPTYISNFVEHNYELLKMIEEFSARNVGESNEDGEKVFADEKINSAVSRLKENLRNVFSTENNLWATLHDKIWSVGERKNSINLLINGIPDYECNIFKKASDDARQSYNWCIKNPFKYTCKSGPLCKERLMNCAFIVKAFEYDPNYSDSSKAGNNRVNLQIVEGHITSLFKKALEKRTLRLMEPVFTTEIQVNTSILRNVHDVIGKRNGKIVNSVCMDEEEKKYFVKAHLPVIDSTDFVDEIRKMTSGQASPNLKYSHYQLIDKDPFYEHKTEDQIDKKAVRASNMLRDARKRKGLPVKDQVVIHAEKERNRNKKK
ncbi:elongation factor-like GTPase 1 [Coccinella septempunctata]|uniref:elongation factor-like GTPase 1 n=1 Tax=Coccinella septempunctata TaxID=41139 RepID=UPI001D06CA4B|nr:elongation factor-like GTPase 1 [Coccinella septempunctata]